jgi:hypothetical protein
MKLSYKTLILLCFWSNWVVESEVKSDRGSGQEVAIATPISNILHQISGHSSVVEGRSSRLIAIKYKRKERLVLYNLLGNIGRCTT